jgi:hypothetical protein
MKTTPALVREWNSLRADKTLTARARVEKLLALETTGRPGGPEVREWQQALLDKIYALKQRAAAEPRFTPEQLREAIAQPARFGSEEALASLHWAPYRRLCWKRQQERAERLEAMRQQDANQGYIRQAHDLPLGLPIATDLAAQFATGPAIAGRLDEIGPNHQRYFRIRDWWISAEQRESRSRSAYSKTWHRQHGPKVTVTGRIVRIRRFDPAAGKVENRDVRIDSWRGNWLLGAVIEAGIVAPVKVPAKLRPVQLHPAFAVEPVRTLGGVAIYRRLLGGQPYDFCVLWHGLAYHAETPRECLKGLRQKLQEVERRENAPIDWALCKSLGFCDEGLRQFCRDFDLDPKGRYMPEELRAAVEKDLSSAAKYREELHKIARTVGYAVPQGF